MTNPFSLGHTPLANAPLAISSPPATSTSPIIPKDWPNPRGTTRSVDLLTVVSTSIALLSAVFPAHNYDFPNPRSATPSIELRTHTHNYQFQLQDTFFGLAGHPNYDQPNPRGPVPSIDLRTWTSFNSNLIGQDKFFGLAGHPNFDQPTLAPLLPL
jgi:hypothetical protein